MQRSGSYLEQLPLGWGHLGDVGKLPFQHDGLDLQRDHPDDGLLRGRPLRLDGRRQRPPGVAEARLQARHQQPRPEQSPLRRGASTHATSCSGGLRPLIPLGKASSARGEARRGVPAAGRRARGEGEGRSRQRCSPDNLSGSRHRRFSSSVPRAQRPLGAQRHILNKQTNWEKKKKNILDDESLLQQINPERSAKRVASKQSVQAQRLRSELAAPAGSGHGELSPRTRRPRGSRPRASGVHRFRKSISSTPGRHLAFSPAFPTARARALRLRCCLQLSVPFAQLTPEVSLEFTVKTKLASVPRSSKSSRWLPSFPCQQRFIRVWRPTGLSS